MTQYQHANALRPISVIDDAITSGLCDDLADRLSAPGTSAHMQLVEARQDMKRRADAVERTLAEIHQRRAAAIGEHIRTVETRLAQHNEQANAIITRERQDLERLQDAVEAAKQRLVDAERALREGATHIQTSMETTHNLALLSLDTEERDARKLQQMLQAALAEQAVTIGHDQGAA